jgi:hypothetical protein
LEFDAQFLLDQLRYGQVAVLLLNGQGVIAEFESVSGVHLEEAGRLSLPARAPSRIVKGLLQGIVIVGWTVNLQSSWGVSSALHWELGEILKNLTGARRAEW